VKFRYLTLLSLSVLTACNSASDPTKENFGKAIDAYLAKRGELCLNSQAWPFELSDMQKRMGNPFGGAGPAGEMEALKSQGLVSSNVVERPVTAFGVGATGRMERVTRYELTAEGERYLRVGRNELHAANKGATRGSLCYGRKALEKVVKWEGPIKLGDYQSVSVKYLYRVVDLAEWASSEEIQAAFPHVKQVIHGAGTKQQSHGVKLTSEGWEANGIDRE